MSQSVSQRAISPAQAVEYALKLLERNPALAERQAREILKVLPDDVRAIFIVGTARRRAGDTEAARAILERLVRVQPDSAYAQHEYGLTLASLGESEAAITALRRAAALAEDLPDPWISLSDQLSLAGDAEGSARAYAEHVRASLKTPALIAAADALRENRPRDAEQMLRAHLLANPADVAALRLFGETASRLGHTDDAEEILARCVEHAPDFVGARHSYALVLFEQNKALEALAHIEHLLARTPGEAKYLALLAACHAFLGDYDRALDILRQVLAEHPRQAKVWVTYGQSLRIVGRREEAIAAFRQAIALQPGLGDAFWNLADFKTVGLGAAEVAAMRAQLADPALADEDRVHMHYALGRILEDSQDWAESFSHFAQGARLRRAAGNWDADAHTAQMETTRALFNAGFFETLPAGGCADTAPIFILGLPRAGSTLLEQILGSHPKVEATMELADMTHITARLGRAGRAGRGPDYATTVSALTGDERRALGEEYIARTQRYRTQGKPFFIDKMPGNFAHIGFIRTILPNAKIIDVRRHPMASCFALFKQLFYRGQMFSYEQTEIARYYCDYAHLMAHFDCVLPGWIHRVIYDDLVEDTEAEIRRLLAFCGLPFDAACLDFWTSARAVPTHSSEQVRQPIFRSGLERWRHYEPWLGPIHQGVQPVMPFWRQAAGR